MNLCRWFMLGIEVYRVTRNTRTYLSYFILPPAYSRQDYKHSISIPPDRSFKYASVGQRDFIKFSIKWNNGERVWDFFQISLSPSLSLSFSFSFLRNFVARWKITARCWTRMMKVEATKNIRNRVFDGGVYLSIRVWVNERFVQAFSDLPRCVDCYSKCNAVNAFDPC